MFDRGGLFGVAGQIVPVVTNTRSKQVLIHTMYTT